jgi:hypothetical protein
MNTPQHEPDQDQGTLITVEAMGVDLQFHGRSLATATTETPVSTRWIELELWQMTDGTGRFVLQSIGCSRVYHRVNSPCNTGSPIPAFELPDAAVPCPVCEPLPVEALTDDHTVCLEDELYKAHVCATGAEVIQRLQRPDGGLAKVSLRLLQWARAQHPDVADELRLIQQL